MVAAMPAAMRSTEPRIPMISPSSRIRLRFSSRIGAPPPVSTTIHAGVGRSDAMTLDSRSRNDSIPSCSITSLLLLRARRAMARSVSTTLAPSIPASRGATVLLPMPGGPTRKRCTSPLFPLIDRTEARAIALDRCDEIVRGIAPELLDERMGQDGRAHRFRDDTGGRDDAHIAALDVRRRRSAGAQIRRGKRLHERRDRFERHLEDDVLAVAHTALEATGAVTPTGELPVPDSEGIP